MAGGKTWDDADSDVKEFRNLVLMADSEIIKYGPKSQVKFTDAEIIYHLSGSLDCAQRDNKRMILENTTLENEVLELRKVHINQDELKTQVSFLENMVKFYKELETILKGKIADLELKASAMFKSCTVAKEIFNKQAVDQTVGIGYDYNEAVGLLGINTPNLVSAKERGIPHVLKGVDEPLFRKSVAETPNLLSIVIQEEMRIEDVANGIVLNNDKSAKNKTTKNVKSKKVVPKKPVKVDESTSSCTTGLGFDKKKKCNNMTNMHAMPVNNSSHKPCGILNCMQCAFNVMSSYFNSMNASSNMSAPRQFINHKKHVRSRTVTPPNPSSRTSNPPKVMVKTWTPKLKPKSVKAVYRVKCAVPVKDVIVKIKNVVLPDKGQFFKYSGPNQIWVLKEV